MLLNLTVHAIFPRPPTKFPDFFNSQTIPDSPGHSPKSVETLHNWPRPVNPLIGTGNCSATSNNIKLVHWPLMGGLLHLVQRGGDWAGPQPTQGLLAVPNVTAHTPMASVPITILLYNDPLLCGFNVTIKGLTCHQTNRQTMVHPV